MYTKYYTKQIGSKIAKASLNHSIFPVKSNRTKSNPKTFIRAAPRVKTACSKQKPQIPRNDLMFNLAMSNMVKFQDAIATRPIITNCLSMSNIEDKKNEEKYLNDSNDLIQKAYQPEPLPQKANNNLNEQSNTYYHNKLNDRKLLYTLKTLDLENLFIGFNLNSITFNDLFLLSKEDLLELRIPLGPRNRLLHFAEEYKKTAKDYDYKELTQFFQNNKCFLINYVQDFSCSNFVGYSNYNENRILLSPKGNIGQPNSNIINHVSSLDNVSSINLNSNFNLKEDFGNIQRSNRLNNNCYNLQQLDKENDKDSENTNMSLLKELSFTNTQHNTLFRNDNNKALVKKNSHLNSFFYSNDNNQIKNGGKNTKNNHEDKDKILNKNLVSKIVCPMPSLNHSITSLPNANPNNNVLQTIPLTIANIEEPIRGNENESIENNSNETQSFYCYANKQVNLNKTASNVNPSLKQTQPNQKTKNNKSQFIQSFQNIFIEVEQFQHQYESMKQKNDQKKTKMNTLMNKKKENELHNRVNYTQPRNQISYGKEDLFNESERNLNDELSKLYDSDIKTSSNTSIQQHQYFGTHSNKNNNSHYF